MQCANPECGSRAQSIFDGKLTLLELEVPPAERMEGDGEGFPVCVVPSRFFWLCARCAARMQIRRWTPMGLVFQPTVHGEIEQIRKPTRAESRKKPVMRAGMHEERASQAF